MAALSLSLATPDDLKDAVDAVVTLLEDDGPHSVEIDGTIYAVTYGLLQGLGLVQDAVASGVAGVSDVFAVFEGGTLSETKGGGVIAPEDSVTGFNTGTPAVPGVPSAHVNPIALFETPYVVGAATSGAYTLYHRNTSDLTLQSYDTAGLTRPSALPDEARVLRFAGGAVPEVGWVWRGAADEPAQGASYTVSVAIVVAEGEDVYLRARTRKSDGSAKSFTDSAVAAGTGAVQWLSVVRTWDPSAGAGDYSLSILPFCATAPVHVLAWRVDLGGTPVQAYPVDVPGIPAGPSARDIVQLLNPGLGDIGQVPTLVDDGSGGRTIEYQTPSGGTGSTTPTDPNVALRAPVRPLAWHGGALDGIQALSGIMDLVQSGDLGIGEQARRGVIAGLMHSFGRYPPMREGMIRYLGARGLWAGGQAIPTNDHPQKDLAAGGWVKTFNDLAKFSSSEAFNASGGLATTVTTAQPGGILTLDGTGALFADDAPIGVRSSGVRFWYNRRASGGKIELWTSSGGGSMTKAGEVNTAGADADHLVAEIDVAFDVAEVRFTGAAVSIPAAIHVVGWRDFGYDVAILGNGGAKSFDNGDVQMGSLTEAHLATILGATGADVLLLMAGYNSIKDGQPQASEAGAVLVANAVARLASRAAAYRTPEGRGIPVVCLAETAERQDSDVGLQDAIAAAYADALLVEVEQRRGLAFADTRQLLGDRVAGVLAGSHQDAAHPSDSFGIVLGAFLGTLITGR